MIWIAFALFCLAVTGIAALNMRDAGRRARSDITSHMRMINAIDRERGRPETYPNLGEGDLP